jgi:hypothetical protein
MMMTLRNTSIVVGLIVAGLVALVSHGRAAQSSPNTSSTLAAMVAEVLTDSRPAPALTPQHFVDELEHTRDLLERVRAIDSAALSRDEAIDRRLLEAILAGRVVEQESVRRWRLDPLVYMSSTRALIAVFDDDMVFEDPGSHVETLLAALRAMPAELKNGQANLTLNVGRFRDQAMAVTSAATSIFLSDLPALIEMLPAENPALAAAADYTWQSMLEWSSFLKTHLPKRAGGFYAIGIPAYDALLERRHLAAYNSNELYRFAQNALKTTLEELEAAATEIDSKQTWLEILGGKTKKSAADPKSARRAPKPTLAPDTLTTQAAEPPTPVTVDEAIDEARDRMEAMGLPSPPWENRIDPIPRPDALINRVYYPTSSGAVSTDDDGTLVTNWWINPKDPTVNEFLGPDDGAVVSITSYDAVADHLLGLYQLHNASALRRAMRSSTTAEGWDLYVEQLAAGSGAFPPGKAQLRQLQIKLWRIARTIVDVGLHTGKLTEEEATELLTERVGLPAAAAAMEIAEAANAPTAHLGYMGFVELTRIRDEAQQQTGARFSLIDFHKRLLEAGPLPPTLIRASVIDVR